MRRYRCTVRAVHSDGTSRRAPVVVRGDRRGRYDVEWDDDGTVSYAVDGGFLRCRDDPGEFLLEVVSSHAEVARRSPATIVDCRFR